VHLCRLRDRLAPGEGLVGEHVRVAALLAKVLRERDALEL